MADLVTLAEVKDWLRVKTETENVELQDLIDSLEETFEEEVDRRLIPFQAAQTARVEVRDGTGSRELWLDYPIATVTTIELGRDSANRDDTLDPTDVDEVIWVAGERRITRTDGGKWGKYRNPKYVNVTYNAQADLPPAAKRAVISQVAARWRQRGVEGVAVKKLLDSSASMLYEPTPEWLRAVNDLKRYALV